MATVFGMALGGWMSGVIFDLTGSYQAAFVNRLIWNLVNLSIALWLLTRPAGGPPGGEPRLPFPPPPPGGGGRAREIRQRVCVGYFTGLSIPRRFFGVLIKNTGA